MAILTITLEDPNIRTSAGAAAWIATHLAKVSHEIGSTGGRKDGEHDIVDVDRKVVGIYVYTPSAKHPG